jgi:hypothetical protein
VGPSEALESRTFPGGAALVGGGRAWVLVEDEPGRALGPALVWARRAGAPALSLVVDETAGALARRATAFADPVPEVLAVEGGRLVRAEPEPLSPAPPLDPQLELWAPVLRDAGCDVVVEFGRLVGEVLGLEVARVVIEKGAPRLEVGVGRFDREAHAELAGTGAPTPEALRRVVTQVREQRRPGAPSTPLARLAPERRLRALLRAKPALVGAERLLPVAPASDAPLRSPAPAPAVGATAAGEPLVVVASAGIDLDLVPTAADVRAREAPEARLVLAVPPKDASPVTRDLARALRAPAEVAEVDR